MGRKYDDEDGSDQEGDALILHRLGTDAAGRPIVHTLPAGTNDGPEARATDAYADELNDEEIALPPRDVVHLEKTGRPTWLLDALSAARHNARFRLALLLIGAGVVLAAFAFAFSDGGTGKRIYGTAGDWWRGEARPWKFDTDVGFPGPTSKGAPPMMAHTHAGGTPTRGAMPIETRIPTMQSDFRPFEHMGPLSPYYASPGFGVDNAVHRDLPKGCKVNTVHILHRHGSRYPTSGSPTELIKSALSRTPRPTFTGALAFLNTYAYRVGAELLVPLGRQQLFDSGVKSAMEYGELMQRDVEGGRKMLVRAGSQHRIVESAMSWLEGAWGEKWHANTDLEIQIEAPHFNTTLAANFACASAGLPGSEPGYEWSRAWVDKYLASAVVRLGASAQGLELTPRLLYGMQQLCAYDTVAFGHSDFCALFTKEEWLGLEWAWDLTFYGAYGPGSPVGKAQGVGWLNEFLARLTKTPWDARLQTSENATLASDNTTFPLDRSVYADFTHDSSIAGVLAALGLRNLEENLLPWDQPRPRRAYRTSTLVPFAARLVFEDVTCSNSNNDAAASAQHRLVRMLLNDAVFPLDQLGPDCPKRADGMCAFDGFIHSQKDRMERAQWGNCTRSHA